MVEKYELCELCKSCFLEGPDQLSGSVWVPVSLRWYRFWSSFMRSTDLRSLMKVKIHILGRGVGFSLVDSGQWTRSLWYWEEVGFLHACIHPRSTGLTEWYTWSADVELTSRGRAWPRVLIQAWELISKNTKQNRTIHLLLPPRARF